MLEKTITHIDNLLTFDFFFSSLKLLLFTVADLKENI